MQGGDGQADHTCVGCTNKDTSAVYTSSGTVTDLIGNNDCAWQCGDSYYGPSTRLLASQQGGTGGECLLCSTSVCGAGTYREVCLQGEATDAACVACSPRPLFSTLGVAEPYNQDACIVYCNEGWYGLPGHRFCCSDNSYINGTGLCTCSAGFRIGPKGVDGADCRP